MIKSLIKVGLVLGLSIGSLNASDMYLMGQNDCRSLSSYGLPAGVEGYKQFINNYQCTLVKKDMNVGYFLNQCKKLNNQMYFIFVAHNN